MPYLLFETIIQETIVTQMIVTRIKKYFKM